MKLFQRVASVRCPDYAERQGTRTSYLYFSEEGLDGLRSLAAMPWAPQARSERERERERALLTSSNLPWYSIHNININYQSRELPYFRFEVPNNGPRVDASREAQQHTLP